MGGDRRSPPRRRGRGDGGGRLKGTMGVSVLARGRGIMTGLSGNSSVSNVKTQHKGAAVKEVSISSDSLNLSSPGKVQDPNIGILGNSDLPPMKSDSNYITNTGVYFCSNEDRDGQHIESVNLAVPDNNLDIQDNDKIEFFHMPELINNSDSGKFQESVTYFLANSDLGILDSRTNCIINTGDVLSSEEGSEPVLLTDGRKDSDHSAINHTMKLHTGDCDKLQRATEVEFTGFMDNQDLLDQDVEKNGKDCKESVAFGVSNFIDAELNSALEKMQDRADLGYFSPVETPTQNGIIYNHNSDVKRFGNVMKTTDEAGRHEDSAMLNDMTFKVHNPMFWMDNPVTGMNADCDMDRDDNIYAEEEINGMDDRDDHLDNGNRLAVESNCFSLEDNCMVGGPSNAELQQVTKSGFKGDSGQVNEVVMQSTFGSEGPAVDKTVKQGPNAWKKPAHVLVDWYNRGRATDDGKFVNLNMEAVSNNLAKLDKALVGRLIGKRLPFSILKAELKKRWDAFGDFRFLMMGDDCFTCIFNSVDARDAVLMGGPWLIGGYIVGLDRWSHKFSHESMNGLTAPVWIRFPKLPLLYWDNDNLARIASMIGQPLWIDAQTSMQGRCAYARVCVRLDLSQKLSSGVWIHGVAGNFFQSVEYEGIHQVCFRCGHIGHREDRCTVRMMGEKGMRDGNSVDGTANDAAVFGWKKNGVKTSIHPEAFKKTAAVYESVPHIPKGGSSLVRGECRKPEVNFRLDAVKFGEQVDKGESSNLQIAVQKSLVYKDIMQEVGATKQTDTAQIRQMEKGESSGLQMEVGSPLEENSGDRFADDDPRLGPWIFVTRKKGRSVNFKGKAINLKGLNSDGDHRSVRNLKANNISFADFSTITGKVTTEEKEKEIAVEDRSSLKGKELHVPAVVFSANREEGNSVSGEGKAASFRMRNYKERGSNRVPSAREISNLGPITAGPRKRRKGDTDCGDLMDLQDFCNKESDGAVLGSKEGTSERGGDASPLVK